MATKPFDGVGAAWIDLRGSTADVLAWQAHTADSLLNSE
jgi:hypothetical protein